MATWQRDVALARWRGDLLEYHAAALQADPGDTSTREGARAALDVFDKSEEAELHRKWADVLEDYETNVAPHVNETKNGRYTEEALAAQAKQREFMEFRSYWRGIHEFAGKAPVQTINDFPEPSDDELTGGKS